MLAIDRAIPNTIRAGGADPEPHPMPKPEQRREGDLQDRAGQDDRPHRQQILEREMQADPEHQQDHADLGELRREARVRDKPGVNGPTAIPASK